MLRITPVHDRDVAPALKLEGKLLEPWGEELLRACEALPSRSLDLSAVTFADASGIELLRGLLQRGIRISACSGYIAELLQLEKR